MWYLVGQLVCYDNSHSLFAGGRVSVLVVQKSCLPIGDQPPVLHGTSREVGNGKQV